MMNSKTIAPHQPQNHQSQYHQSQYHQPQNQQLFHQEYKRLPLGQKEQIKQELRNKIQEALQIARILPFEASLQEIRKRLDDIQQYCQSIGKGFIFVEQEITCNQYKLQGSDEDTAILFRGPNEDASVAICLTQKGSLLYRNDCPWRVYRDAGDIGQLSEVAAIGS